MRVGLPRPRRATATERRRAGLRVWLASLIVTVLAIAPVLAIFHQISARHAVCEHGQLVESDHDAPAFGTSPESSIRDVAQEGLVATLRADSDAVAHSHGHCSVGTLARSGVGILTHAALTALPLPSAALVITRPTEFAAVRTILLSAPKTSPPALSAIVSG